MPVIPVRRASASAGHVAANAASGSSSKVHRSNDSYHAYTGHSTAQPSNNSGLYGSIPGPSTTPQQKVIHVLVNRLKNKLPCNSGLSLETIEADRAVQQAVESLVELSRDSLDIIAWALSELLEKLAKQTDPNGHFTIEVLQSQLFILKVLAGAMSSRWYSSQDNPRSSSRASKPSIHGALISGMNKPGSPVPSQGHPKQRNVSSDHFSTSPTFSEPIPLDDNCARYILSVMVLFLRQTAPLEHRLMSSANLHFDSSTSFYDLESVDLPRPTSPGLDVWAEASVFPASNAAGLPKPAIRTQASLSSMASNGSTRTTSFIPIPHHSLSLERTPPTLCRSSMQLNVLVSKFAGRIVYHLSASNWSVVFNRIRNKIHFLATASEDNPDIIDLGLMTHSALDRVRLIQIMQELSSLLLNMKREAQAAVAIPLRSAIWKWIDLFPEEFNDAVRSARRMEGAAERVFDLLYERNDAENRRSLWPTLTVLMCISSERLRTDQENHFVEQLVRNITTWTKLAEIALVCALDVCRAAIRVRPEGEIPLISIATDIAHEIKVRLHLWKHSGQKPFWESGDEIDVSLFTDVLTTLFRFLPEDESIAMFKACLEPERSDAVKTIAIKAALALTLEAPSIPWQPPREKLDEMIAPRLRSIFKSVATRTSELDPQGNVRRSAARPKSKRYTSETLSDRELLILAICSLWRANYHYYFIALQILDTPDWVPVAIKVWESPMDSCVKQSSAWSIRYLGELIFSMTPNDKYFKDAVLWMKLAIPSTFISLGTNLLNSRIDLKSQRMWIDLMHDLLAVYTKETEYEEIKALQIDSNRVAAFALTEIAFLVSLTSVDHTVSRLAAQCLQLIAKAEQQPGAPPHPNMSEEERTKRHQIYDQLGDRNRVAMGRVGEQKRIRKLLKSIASPSPAHIAVWEECYWRWCSLAELTVRAPMDALDGQNGHNPIPDMSMTHEQRHFQWQNLTLFLAAFGSACAGDHHDMAALTATIPAKYLPDNMRVLRDPEDLVGSFISNSMDLLVSDTASVRDVAREALGAELSPRLHSRLLKHLEEVVLDVVNGGSSEWAEHFAIFLEQFIAVLKLLIENVEDPAEELKGIDLNQTLFALASFIAHFHDPASYRTRMRFTSLCESVYARMESLVLRKDSHMCHELLDIVMEWIQDPSTVRTDEVNMSSLRTAVRLMDRLQLEKTEGAAGDSSGHVASRLFIRYSSLLLRALDFGRSAVLMPDDNVSDISSYSQRTRASRRDSELRELVVTGLAHLVISNTESSFKHCLPLAYDDDFRKRAIFANVFSRVLSQGTKFDSASATAIATRRSRLCEVSHFLLGVLAVAICETCPSSEVDVIIPVLFNLFDTRASLMHLMKTMIDREIAHTSDETDLFRGNSTCCRLLSAFARQHGYNYLRSLITPLIKTMTSLPAGRGYELDPTKIGDQDVLQNKKNVEVVATSFLAVISASVPSLPSMFREICAHIAKAVHEVWPEAKFAALGAFIFLRFISPAIVAPDIVDVEVPKDDGGVIRRGLMVIAKIIQNLANNIFFGKEAHMEILNDFLRDNIVNVTRYLSEVNKYSTSGADEDANEWLGNRYDDTDTIVLHRFFEKHADKVGKELLSLSKPATEGDPAVDGKQAWDALCAALVDLGQPLEVPRLSPLTSSEHRDYHDLMSRYNHRSTDSVRDLFVETDIPKVSIPAIFVLRASKVDVEALDVELLMFHVFKTLALPAYESRMFEVIVDCTAFTGSSEVPVQWIKYCTEVIPWDVRQRFMTAYILNPNALTQRYLRRLYNISAGSEVRAYPSVDELLGHVPEACLAALSYPTSLEREPYEGFKDIVMRHAQQMRMPVLVDVGLTHLRITSVKPQPISPNLSCKSTEIISLAEVTDVYNVSTGYDPYEFIIRRSRHGVTLYFSSILRDAIVKAIRSAKGRMRSTHIPALGRFSRLSNVSATLLHVGLYSVGLEDEDVRLAAYDLLAAVCSYLDYDGSPVVPSKAGFVPAHPTTFVLNLSERLASHVPHLTLDFFSEVAAGMDKGGVAQKIFCLQYMSPWVKNLSHFPNPASPYYEHSGARLRDCVRLLVELTITEHELDALFQKYIWAEIGKLDSNVVNVVLDELMRTAMDGGIDSRRCEIVTNTLAAMSSLNTRGRIISKLRKVLGKTSTKPTKTLAENVHWNEIASLIRLVLVVSAPCKQVAFNQFYVPELVYLVALLAGIGQTAVRASIYGIVMNMLQALYLAFAEDPVASVEIRGLLDECTQTDTLRLFGLTRASPTTEFSSFDAPSDRVFIEMGEQLTSLLVRVMDVGATSKGLLNVWRARWMSLVTSTAFQLSPAIQSRAFINLGTLATSDVDDDLLYQMLVAFKTSLSQSDETNTLSVVTMLRCLSRVIPALVEGSRYLSQVFWLAVALLQSSQVSFYAEAADLLRVSVEKLDVQGALKDRGLATTLLDARAPLEDVACQLDQILGLSFDSNFSFSLASIIFKGVRHSGLRPSATALLKVLLRASVRSAEPVEALDGLAPPLSSEATGYFLALVPLCASYEGYAGLLKDCNADSFWYPRQEPRTRGDSIVPRAPFEYLGIADSNSALLVTSFLGTMLATAQGDDAETEMLYNLLSDMANIYPEIVQLTFESLQDRIKDTFAHSSNPAILSAVSNVFRVAMQDPTRNGIVRGSSSSLSTVDEATSNGPGRNHLMALEELNMQGLPSTFTFLPSGKGLGTKMLNWIPGLVVKIIDSGVSD
ncbi:hypothetical protein JAAARDRAFT_118551 [Jaapia argillacea MUCL 33604]|uniref:Ras-GAP domain-containing protein n=1 Tax=Jaapia argillacea MUCL 33604 TaxID=933084 RepID=A0A067QD73_9AGAM|nr:hypothetical protein JAAARDRAFT_118551 [Jaapia argillacea MUCL 33604]